MAVAVDATYTGIWTTGSTWTVTGIAAAADMLYVVDVGIRGSGAAITSVSGGGLTWIEVKAQTGGRNQIRGKRFAAVGNAGSTFTLTVTCSGTLQSGAATVQKISGAVVTSVAAAFHEHVGHNTNGENGGSSGGTDSTAGTVTFSPGASVGMHLACHQGRLTANTLDTDYTSLANHGGGSQAGGTLVQQRTGRKTTQVSGDDTCIDTWGANTDWFAIGSGIIAATVDTTPPVANITVGPSRTKISSVSGFDETDITFQVNEACQAWKVKVVPATDSVHTAGTQIESGGSVANGGTVNVTITDDELVAADPGEGSKIIKVFIQDSAGNWST